MSDKIIDLSEKKKERGIGVVKSLDSGVLTQDDIGSGVWDAEIQAFLEATTLKGLYYNEDWVFMLLDLVAEHVSMSPMIVKKVVAEKNGKTIEETVDSHPVLTILEMPNEFQEYSHFMYNYVVEYDLMGNSILFYSKSTQSLVIIPTESANLAFDKAGKFAGYNIINQGADGTDIDMLFRQQDAQFFARKDIWHQRRPNPKSLVWGLSPFVPNRKSILFNRYTQDWLNSFYLKGATPTTALSMEKNVDEKSALRFLRSFEMAYTGRRNMRRPLVLPKGVSVETLSPTVADQQLIELVKQNREQIINILRVPKHALSLAESGSLGSEEHKQALKFFYQSAIIPTQIKIQKFLTRKFQEVGLMEEDERLEFDNSEVEVLRDDMIKKAELSEKLKSVWTLNEIRTKLWDMEEVKGGDQVESTSAAPEQPFFQFSKPAPEPIPEAVIETKEYVDEAATQTKEFRDSVHKMVKEKYSRSILLSVKQLVDVVENEGDKVKSFWEKIFKNWGSIAAKIAKEELRKSKPLRKAKDDDSPEKIPSKKRMKKKIQEAMDGDNEDWLDLYNESFKSVVEDAYDVATDVVVGEDNKEAIEALKAKDEKKRSRILEARGIASFKSIREGGTEKAMALIAKAVEDQVPIRDIGKMLEKKFTELSPAKAQTIARTEALTAVSIGKQAALVNTKKVIPDILKVWINLGDDRVRDAHREPLNGEAVPADEPFSNGLMYPRDVKADDPGETINCRCDFLMVPPEDIESLLEPGEEF